MPTTTVLPFALTERDFQILMDLEHCAALTAAQISHLRFPLSIVKGAWQTHSNCQRRLQLLYSHGYLRRYEQPVLRSEGRKPYLYYLSPKGVELLADWPQCTPATLTSGRERSRQLNGAFLNHLMLTNDVRIALMQAAAAPSSGVSLLRWIDERTLKRTHSQDKFTLINTEGRERTHVLVPDGYFQLRTASPDAHDYHHFLEVDRGTETGRSSVEGRRDWALKVRMYLAYYAGSAAHPGLYQQRYHTNGGRVLTITTSEQRLQHLKRITEEVGGKARFWFTTFDQLAVERLLSTPIWHIATKHILAPLIG